MMTKAPEIMCPRCRVSVPVDKIALPDRCPLGKDCPLNQSKADE